MLLRFLLIIAVSAFAKFAWSETNPQQDGILDIKEYDVTDIDDDSNYSGDSKFGAYSSKRYTKKDTAKKSTPSAPQGSGQAPQSGSASSGAATSAANKPLTVDGAAPAGAPLASALPIENIQAVPAKDPAVQEQEDADVETKKINLIYGSIGTPSQLKPLYETKNGKNGLKVPAFNAEQKKNYSSINEHLKTKTENK